MTASNVSTTTILPMQHSPVVVVDALNLAYWCGSPASLRVPLTVLSGLIDQGHSPVLYFDASTRYRLVHEADRYQELLSFPRTVVEVPSGKSADGLMLKHARATGACIISRDKFRDHRRRYRKLIDDATRLFPGVVAEDRVIIQALSLDVPLLPSLDEIWQHLILQLQTQSARVIPQ